MREPELIEALHRLPREHAPPPMLWVRIAERTAGTPPRGRRRALLHTGLALAASLAALALLVPLWPPANGARDAQARMLAREAAAIRIEYEAALAQLPPATPDSHLQAALDALARRTAGLDAAARAAPDDVDVLYALQRAWAQRLRVARLAVEFRQHRGDA